MRCLNRFFLLIFRLTTFCGTFLEYLIEGKEGGVSNKQIIKKYKMDIIM